MPFIARLRATTTQPIGVILPKLPAPFADGFVGHGDTALEQEFLHVAIAQGEAIVEPDAMTDDLAGKAVVLVTLGVGRRGHVWLPILGCNGSWRGHRRGQLCHGSGRMVNKLTKPEHGLKHGTLMTLPCCEDDGDASAFIATARMDFGG